MNKAAKQSDYYGLVVFGELLNSYGLVDIVGASVLHKHFTLESDEIILLNHTGTVVHVFLYSSITSITRHLHPLYSVEDSLQQHESEAFVIQASGAMEHSVVPYMFKLDSDPYSAEYGVFPLQYVMDTDEFMQHKYDVVLSDVAFLRELGDVMRTHGLLDRIGFFIRNNEEGVQYETTDEDERTQQFWKQEGVGEKDLITAYVWNFESGEENPAVVRACQRVCLFEPGAGHIANHHVTL